MKMMAGPGEQQKLSEKKNLQARRWAAIAISPWPSIIALEYRVVVSDWTFLRNLAAHVPPMNIQVAESMGRYLECTQGVHCGVERSPGSYGFLPMFLEPPCFQLLIGWVSKLVEYGSETSLLLPWIEGLV